MTSPGFVHFHQGMSLHIVRRLHGAQSPARSLRRMPLKDRPSVPGHGSSEEGIVIVGRDPGRTEVAQGKPFVGDSGILLNEELGFNGI